MNYLSYLGSFFVFLLLLNYITFDEAILKGGSQLESKAPYYVRYRPTREINLCLSLRPGFEPGSSGIERERVTARPPWSIGNGYCLSCCKKYCQYSINTISKN